MTTSVSDALVERVALALCAREADVRMLDSDGAAALWRQNRSRHLKEAHAAIAAIPPEGRVREALLKIAAGGRMGDPIYSAKEAQQIARTALQGDTK